jgi:hypothetical protein
VLLHHDELMRQRLPWSASGAPEVTAFRHHRSSGLGLTIDIDVILMRLSDCSCCSSANPPKLDPPVVSPRRARIRVWWHVPPILHDSRDSRLSYSYGSRGCREPAVVTAATTASCRTLTAIVAVVQYRGHKPRPPVRQGRGRLGALVALCHTEGAPKDVAAAWRATHGSAPERTPATFAGSAPFWEGFCALRSAPGERSQRSKSGARSRYEARQRCPGAPGSALPPM